MSDFALGGAANAITDMNRLALGERQLDLQERQFATGQNQAAQAQAREQLKATAELLVNMKSEFPGSSQEFQSQLSTTVQSFLEDADILARVGGVPGASARLRAQLSSMPTAIERVTQEAQQEVAGAAATAEALTGAGQPTTTMQAAEGAGLIPTTPEPPEIVQLQAARDNALAQGKTEEAAQIQNEIVKRGTVVGRTPTDEAVTGVSARDIPGIRESVAGSAQSLATLENLSRTLAETPEATGLLGPVIEQGGGVVEQLPGGRRALQTLGVSPSEVRGARTEARATTAQFLEAITGEESGRFTDAERRLAETTLSALDPTASAEAVQAALEVVQRIEQASLDRQARRLLEASGDDLNTDEGLRAFFEVLRAQGLSEDQAVATLERLLGE